MKKIHQDLYASQSYRNNEKKLSLKKRNIFSDSGYENFEFLQIPKKWEEKKNPISPLSLGNHNFSWFVKSLE